MEATVKYDKKNRKVMHINYDIGITFIYKYLSSLKIETMIYWRDVDNISCSLKYFKKRRQEYFKFKKIEISPKYIVFENFTSWGVLKKQIRYNLEKDNFIQTDFFYCKDKKNFIKLTKEREKIDIAFSMKQKLINEIQKKTNG